MTPEEASGEIECVGDTLTYRSGLGGWTIPISSICLIAEYTNSDGPYLDDHFLIFLTEAERGWHEASYYAKGRDAAVRLIEEKLHTSLATGLANSTEYRSRIMWPEDVRDQALMDIIPPKKQGWWQKLVDDGSRDLAPSQATRKVLGLS